LAFFWLSTENCLENLVTYIKGCESRWR